MASPQIPRPPVLRQGSEGVTPSNLEMNNTIPSSPEDILTHNPGDHPPTIAPSLTPPLSWKTKCQLFSACLMNLGNGMNDSAPGALLPSLEQDYHINYATVSLIFIANAVGFILAAPLTHTLSTKLGRRNSYILSLGLIALSYVVIACHPPFPAVVVAFCGLGFGMAMNLALNSVFCANLGNATTTALGCFAGAYGVGGVVAPLFATAMVTAGVRWSYFYVITLGLAVVNGGVAGWAFDNFEETSLSTSILGEGGQEEEAVNEAPGGGRMEVLKLAVKNRTTLLGALFIFAYVGAEVSVSGWVVSFLINYRGGDPSRVGYVSAGFWAGITLGRFLLVYPAHRVGEKISVGLMVVGAIGFQLLTWLIPNIVGEAVAVAVLGVLLGAVFPCATAVFTRLLPRNIQISSLSFVTALGSSGGAVFPFLTGLVAQDVGTMVLHPVCLGLYAVMTASWCFLPKMVKRSD
ncbi:hypothetical protein FE257_006903 [Aspergillus nanangensis]|uniref:Major facilitator superfamily (MFS) profile domain-containing protein n=1 Tax=Aspergillus nanangensis TaxID=2582783 RepID=A0AAD4GVT7_ASPNN|nr:hypothetical protein FE257_006903 [Aspergillus nanangensis]